MANRPKYAADERVHELRVAVKRLRALVRLLKIMDPEAVTILNRELRRVGRSLSEIRDDSVRATWLRKHGLSAAIPHRITSARLRSIEKQVAGIREKAKSKAKDRLTNAQNLDHALGISTHKMQRARIRALEHGQDEDFHEWRKRVKDLLYQLELLGIQKPQSRLRDLGHQLGLAHDCALAEQFIEAHRREYKKKAMKIAAREKRALQRKALEVKTKSLKVSSRSHAQSGQLLWD
jgi:CHAD domain-containing protein